MNAWVFPVAALVLLGYGALSARLRSTVVSGVLVFVVAGVLLGRLGGFLSGDVADQSVRVLAEGTLALLLFTDASVVSVGRLWRDRVLPARLLGIGLPLTIGAGTLMALAIFPDLSPWVAAALATMLAPTDAALGRPVIEDRRVPTDLREGLNVESGLNDGICVPLLIIFLSVAESGEHATHTGPLWVVVTEIGYGVGAGVVAGAFGGWVLTKFAAKGWSNQVWQQINGVVTPLFAYTAADALGGSGFIAAFVAGSVYGTMAGREAQRATVLAEHTGELLDAVTFLVFGAVLLGPALTAFSWPVAWYAIASLTVVRMIPVALALLGRGDRLPTIAFLGWFGPRGLASIVFVMVLVEQAGLAERGLILTVVTWTVGLSVVAHGVTAPLAAPRYAAWVAGGGKERFAGHLIHLGRSGRGPARATVGARVNPRVGKWEPKMTQHGYHPQGTAPARDMSRPPTDVTRAEPRWSGKLAFGATAMLVVGLFNVIIGIVALVNSTYYTISASGLLVLDLTGWGWLHVILGALIIVTGAALFTGATWARVVTAVLAGFNALASLAFMSAYPLWSVIVMALDILVIWAVVTADAEAEA
ncbi:MAG TPA: cation:proton antiporter [Amycolatopsis sp.]|nr:cation:proton antiporter [Amycolatopsis sp.]